jgi:hypothetical protein
MPAGFTADGLPIGIELLGGAWTEAALLNYAFGWEQAARPRRAPFSTPPLVNGAAPAPVTADLAVGPATVKLSYDRTTGALRYDAAAANLAADRVVGLTIQRGEGDQPGPIVAHLLAPNQITGSGTLVLRGADRDALAAGRLFAHLYTRQSPLGAARVPITW